MAGKKIGYIRVSTFAVLYWNTVKMTEIIEQLRKNGEDINNETLSRISLLLHKHVVSMGTYFTDGIIEQLVAEEV